MQWLWTWSGISFGYREGDNLWTHDGKHVGRFVGDTIYGADGRYLGEVHSGNRLVTARARSRMAAGPPFEPCTRRAPQPRNVHSRAIDLRPGYEDFPGPERFA